MPKMEEVSGKYLTLEVTDFRDYACTGLKGRSCVIGGAIEKIKRASGRLRDMEQVCLEGRTSGAAVVYGSITGGVDRFAPKRYLMVARRETGNCALRGKRFVCPGASIQQKV